MLHKFLFLFVILLVSCGGNDSELLNEIDALKLQLQDVQNQLKEKEADESGFIHAVYFWLKEDITKAEKADFMENGLGILKDCGHLSNLYYGPPAGTPRNVVDNSYDYAWICHFKDKAAHDAYQIDPIHTSFVSKYEHLFGKVIVYDNLLIDG